MNKLNTKEQIEFIKLLVNRLDPDDYPTRIKADSMRIRRELNTLSHMQNWDYRYIKG